MNMEEILQLLQVVDLASGHPKLRNINKTAMARLEAIDAGTDQVSKNPTPTSWPKAVGERKI
jgi:hypothetical protein